MQVVQQWCHFVPEGIPGLRVDSRVGAIHDASYAILELCKIGIMRKLAHGCVMQTLGQYADKLTNSGIFDAVDFTFDFLARDDGDGAVLDHAHGGGTRLMRDKSHLAEKVSGTHFGNF